MNIKIKVIWLILFLGLMTTRVAEARVTIMGGLTHEREATVGETYEDVILMRNLGTAPQEVKIYQTDYLFFFDGRSIYGEPGGIKRSNANWINFSPHRVTIPPGDVSEVKYVVSVPDNDSLTGTYWSMIMVEEIPGSSPENSLRPKEEVTLGISQVWRYGIQIVTNIGGTGNRNVKFLNTKLLKEEETRILQVDIENIGERWLKPLLWTELYDEKGSYIGRFEGAQLRVYPGTSVRYRVDLTQVQFGTYKALVVADSGDDDVFGATYTLVFK